MMIYMNTKIQQNRWVYVIFCFCNYASMMASVVMHKGARTDNDTNFQFSVAAQAYHPSSSTGYSAGVASWFLGMAQPLEGDDAAYSLAFAKPGSPELSPLLTDTTVIVNNVPDQLHPVRGRPIALLSLLGINPLVVPADNLSELILLNIAADPHRVLRITLLDMLEQPAAIVDMVTLQNPARLPDVVIVNPNMTAVLAVRPQTGAFGDQGSGISFIMTAIAKDPSKDEPKNDDGFKLEDLALGILRTLPLDNQSHLIAFNNPVSAMKNFVTLHASELLHKVFVGVNVATGTNSGDGAITVLVGHINRVPGTQVAAMMQSVITSSATGADTIVAARSDSAKPVTVAAHCLRTMRTSTGLDYLVVNGGVGHDDHTKIHVHALPLLRESGLLAHAYASPVTVYQGVAPIGRSFVTPPTTSEDLYTSNSVPALVGNGPLHAPATDMVVAGDAVFVATDKALAGTAPGVWHSQAIFGPEGTIIAWTPWRRTGGASSAVPLKKIIFDTHAGTWWFLTEEAPHARMTSWNAVSPLSSLVKNMTRPEDAFYHMNDVARDKNPGLLVMAGRNTVLVVQTDSVQAGVVWPRTDFSNGYLSVDGTLSTLVPGQCYPWLLVSGGDLARMKSMVTSAIIPQVNDRTLLVVAGAGGIAMLTTSEGLGLKPGEDFSGATSDMAWRMLPIMVHGQPLKDVRKITIDKGLLYILTSTELLRMPVNSLILQPECIVPVILASIKHVGGAKNSTFSDLFITGPLACLATSIGCFRTGDGVDVAAISSKEQAQWMRINLPHSPGPVVSFTPVGPIAHAHDKGYDANLYVLSAAATSFQARIYRLTISHAGTITDTTVSLFPDEIVHNQRSFFLSLGDYRSTMATDGALLCLARNRYGTKHAYAELLSPDWWAWPLGLIQGMNIVRGAYRRVVPEQAAQVRTMMHDNGLGSWLMLTDIGLTSND